MVRSVGEMFKGALAKFRPGQKAKQQICQEPIYSDGNGGMITLPASSFDCSHHSTGFEVCNDNLLRQRSKMGVHSSLIPDIISMVKTDAFELYLNKECLAKDPVAFVKQRQRLKQNLRYLDANSKLTDEHRQIMRPINKGKYAQMINTVMSEEFLLQLHQGLSAQRQIHRAVGIGTKKRAKSA